MHERPFHRIDAHFLAECTCIRVGISVYVMAIMQKHTIMIQVHVTYNDGLDRAYTALKWHVWRWHLLWFLAFTRNWSELVDKELAKEQAKEG
jgi:hypothetical protein